MNDKLYATIQRPVNNIFRNNNWLLEI